MDTLTRSDLKSWKLAAARGEAEAQWMLGHWNEEGAGDVTGVVLVAPNPKQALQWYQSAAEQGHVSAQAALSRVLSGAEGVAPAFDQAIAWGKKAVAQGDASAAFNLATIYRDLGKPRTAFNWYRRAATMGDADAHLQLGLCHLFGWGVRQDWDAARAAWASVMDAEPGTTCQRSQEDALYWLAVLDLLGGRHTRRSMAPIRDRLELANADEDHEQANALLNLIGKRRYMAQPPGRKS